MLIEKLIEECKRGDRKAQEQLYSRYAFYVCFGLCLKYSRNKTEAEDNLHDSFIVILEKIGQFKSKGSFEGWMKRIAVNTVLQKYRKEEYASPISENFKDDIEVETEDVNIALETLLQYVQELPNKYRLTFSMYVLDGYSHQAISKQLGTSIGTSKSNLARARLILKEKN